MQNLDLYDSDRISMNSMLSGKHIICCTQAVEEAVS